MSEELKFKPTVAVDIDGVVAAYDGNYRPGIIGEPTDEGRVLLEMLRAEGYSVTLHSTRPVDIVEDWLRDNAIVVDNVSATKPPAVAYVDDRAIRFNGNAQEVVDQVKDLDAGGGPWWRNSDSSNTEHVAMITTTPVHSPAWVAGWLSVRIRFDDARDQAILREADAYLMQLARSSASS